MIDSLYCVDPESWNEISLTGNYFANEFRYVDISLSVCFGQPYCASQNEIESFIKDNKLRLQYMYTNSVNDLDKNSRTEIIKYYVDDKMFYPIDLSKQLKTDFYVREAHIEASANWFELVQDETTYHLINSIREYSSPWSFPLEEGDDPRLSSLYLRLEDV
jgi:hypothetical protein